MTYKTLIDNFYIHYKNYKSLQFAKMLKDVIASARLLIFPTVRASNSFDVTILPNAKGF